MIHTLRIPTKDTYAYIEVQFEGTSEEAFAKYRELTDLVQGKIGSFEKIETFTGEFILYNSLSHEYTDMQGNKLYGGSAYKNSLEKPFDLNRIAPMTAKKHGISEEIVRDMWKRNSQISSGLGTALHAAMEQWFRHRKNGTEKNYHLPKHPFLKQVVSTFPLKDVHAFPEVFVSDIKEKRVGQIDLLVIDETADKTAKIVDYKSDAEIEKHIKSHFHQLSYYAHILKAHGWNITGLEVWNYTDGWVLIESPVLDLLPPINNAGGAKGTSA